MAQGLTLFCRKYVPELRGLEHKFLYEPWKAPVSVQAAAGCIIGKDYPEPLVDHQEQRKVCVQRLKDLTGNVTVGQGSK